jgi:hypothetical protein
MASAKGLVFKNRDFEEFFQGKPHKNPFWDPNGQDCGIIPVRRPK